MTKFEFIKSKINYDGEYPFLDYDGDLRSEKTQIKYKEKLEEIKESGLTASGYMKQKLGFSKIPDYKSKIVESDYPYCDNHFILWINSGNKKEDLDDLEYYVRLIFNETKREMKKDMPNAIIFRNKQANKSVELTHFHIIFQ